MRTNEQLAEVQQDTGVGDGSRLCYGTSDGYGDGTGDGGSGYGDGTSDGGGYGGGTSDGGGYGGGFGDGDGGGYLGAGFGNIEVRTNHAYQ